jgi:hypothetical protein
MLGTDQMVWPGVIERAIAGIEEGPFPSASQKRDILYNNAARFLRLDGQTMARSGGDVTIHAPRCHPGQYAARKERMATRAVAVAIAARFTSPARPDGCRRDVKRSIPG